MAPIHNMDQLQENLGFLHQEQIGELIVLVIKPFILFTHILETNLELIQELLYNHQQHSILEVLNIHKDIQQEHKWDYLKI